MIGYDRSFTYWAFALAVVVLLLAAVVLLLMTVVLLIDVCALLVVEVVLSDDFLRVVVLLLVVVLLVVLLFVCVEVCSVCTLRTSKAYRAALVGNFLAQKEDAAGSAASSFRSPWMP